MNLSCSSKAIKYLMFIFNFFFVITGITLIAVGATIKSNYKQYDTFLDDKYFSLTNLLIATGILIFIISFLGCYGAVKESWIILLAFSVLLGVIFIFELSAGIAGYVLRDKTSSYLTETFHRSMPSYNTSEVYARVWDLIQSEFKCCGVQNPNDWNNTFQNDQLPISCCPKKIGAIGEFHCNIRTATTTSSTTSTVSTTEAAPTTTTTAPSTPSTTKSVQKRSLVEDTQVLPASSEGNTLSTTTPYQQGCEQAFGSFVKAHAVDIGAVGFALSIIQIVGIAISFHLARQLKNQYYST